ncbi:hypothetical protein CHG83_13955 [Salmonella enterica]|nr:hypothetical protein [Salmonella enterica]
MQVVRGAPVVVVRSGEPVVSAVTAEAVARVVPAVHREPVGMVVRVVWLAMEDTVVPGQRVVPVARAVQVT